MGQRATAETAQLPLGIGERNVPTAERRDPIIASEPWMTIGAIARATGLSPDTLRVWQKRYGFPIPVRKPSGHRLYSSTDLRRLRQISMALSRGYRPSEVIGLDGSDLQALLAEERSLDSAGASPGVTLFEHVRRQRLTELTAGLIAEAAALGPLDFLRRLLIPLIERVGDASARGEISSRHAHGFSQRVEDVLRVLRLTYERGATGPRILLATLTGELHRIGLQMAALVIGMARLRPHVLGANQSVAEVAFAWEEQQASVIALSISSHSGGPTAQRQLRELRRLVPGEVAIVAGGRGAVASQPPDGVWLIEDLEDFHGWLRRVGARH
jgi:DNA-binding transcriptional MerR regulator/methylmalonyl-CoA mutase cobalamin-binding subunit